MGPRTLFGGPSFPAFPRQSGVCLVLGTAPCWQADLEAARSLFPDARLMAVNWSHRLAPADFLASFTKEILTVGRDWQRDHFGTDPSRHVCWPPAGDRVQQARRTGVLPPDEAPHADFAWPGTLNGATSSWGAARIAKLMGFSVVLCGVPLDGVGHAVKGRIDEDRRYARFRQRLAEYVNQGEGRGVYSMSGFTRELLGTPDGL